MNAYSLVELGKEKQGIESDRAFAIKNGLTVQNISDWKAGRASPNASNFLKLAVAAGMNINQALDYAEKMESKKHREAGFADIGILASVSLSGVTWLYFNNEIIALAGLLAPVIHYTKSEELKLDRLSAANDEIFESGLRVVV